MARPGFVTAKLRCTNPGCADFNAERIIEMPALGDGVFLMPTTEGPLGSMLNVMCGTCSKTDYMRWSVTPS